MPRKLVVLASQDLLATLMSVLTLEFEEAQKLHELRIEWEKLGVLNVAVSALIF